MEPESTKHGAQIEKSALNRPKWLPDGSQDPFRQDEAPTFTNFWVPSGTPKIDPWPEKGAPGSDVLSSFLEKIVFFTFGLEFSSILDEKTTEKSMHVFKAARDFFKLAPP